MVYWLELGYGYVRITVMVSYGVRFRVRVGAQFIIGNNEIVHRLLLKSSKKLPQ